jgi:hypothetical protein
MRIVMTPHAEAPDRHAMQCMEIWGGSHAAESAVTTPGLDTWVYSRPHQGAAEGGDVRYVSLCGGGVITRLVVADISGHGAGVAEFAGMLRGAPAAAHQRQEPGEAGPGTEP